MFGRMSLGSLFVLALLAPGVCWAQAGYGPGPTYGPTGPMTSPYQGQYAPQFACAPTPNGGNRRTIFEEIPDDRGWLFEDSPLSKSLENSFRHAYFRTEFLLWSIGDPGNVVLGAPLPLGADPRIPANLPVNGRIDTTTQIGLGIVPTLDSVQLHGNNGFRGTFGVPVGPGTFEASAFVLQTNTSTLDLTEVIQTLVDPTDPLSDLAFVAQPVLINGVPSVDELVYDVSYQAVLKTSVWGTEANYVFATPNAGDFITFSPLVGLRYFNFRESLHQTGVYNLADAGGIINPIVGRIDSWTVNNSYGPQIGFRTEMTISRFTVGAEPKVMLGLNSYKANLSTQNIRTNDTTIESPLNIQDKETTFGPMVDVKVYSRLALTQNLHVFAAYNLLWAGQLTRPYENIVYNTTVDAGAFQQNVKTTDAVLQGLSVGAEFRY